MMHKWIYFEVIPTIRLVMMHKWIYFEVIPTIRLVNAHYQTELTRFFLVMRTFQFYSLSNCQTCKRVLLTGHPAVAHTPRTSLSYKWNCLFLKDFLFFSIVVDLQCSVSFCCTAAWPHLFLTLSSIMFHHKWLGIVPCAIQLVELF